MYNFDKLVDRQGTDCIKWDMLERVYGNKDLIPLFIADMDFEVLPQLQEAMVKRAQHPTYGYTMPNPKYYESFINWNKKQQLRPCKRGNGSHPWRCLRHQLCPYCFNRKRGQGFGKHPCL